MRHPEQVANVLLVAQLLADLDKAGDDHEALLHLQADIFRASFRAQLAAGDIARTQKRLDIGKAPGWSENHTAEEREMVGDSPWRLAVSTTSREPKEWWIESEVASRCVRQLRAVGDALAWRVYLYDRRAILALSRNAPTGPIVRKAGLGLELGYIVRDWEKHRRFTLLHDLTSCLRIADVSEVHANGQRLLAEIKASPTGLKRTTGRAQLARVQAAIDAIHAGGLLPGSEHEALWQSSQQLRSHLRLLEDPIARATSEGWAVERIQDRVVGIMDLSVGVRDRPEERLARYRQRMDDLVNRHLGGAGDHCHRALTADTAARHPATAPFGVYPLDVPTRAKLICDFLLIDFRLGDNAVRAAIDRPGVTARCLLPPANSRPDPSADVYEIGTSTNSLRVHSGALWQLLIEFVDTKRWADALVELLNRGSEWPSPLVTFTNERAVWRRLSR